MSTPEEPPQLTRRQLRELRNTAANPIVVDPAEPQADTPPPPTPLPRAAEPVVIPDAPVAPEPRAGEPSADDHSTDEHDGARVLTRREVRQRERLRTASVPVITAEVLAATRAELDADDARAEAADVVEAEVVDSGIVDAVPPAAAVAEDWSDPATRTAAEHSDVEPSSESAEAVDLASGEPAVEEPFAEEPASEPDADAEVAADSETATAEEVVVEEPPAEPEERRVVGAAFGSDLLGGQAADIEVPASFDQLLTRGSAATGALSMPNALILSQTPDGGSLVSPVTATGEVLITGTFSLPDHYGSTGSVPGRADGKDVDAVLVDGELPAASSPTPIAASAAISTIKSADEIIKPPAPEKGSRLMVVLAITAGVLAVALAGVLILAITTGVF